MAFYDTKKIFDQTNDGLQIIQWLYEDADCNNLNKKFKARGNEKTASAKLSLYDGIYWVTDFGGDGKPRNAIQCVMLENNCTFQEALEIIAVKFNLPSDDGKKPERKSEYTYNSRPATDDEQPGKFYFTLKEGFTHSELCSIFSDKIMQHAKVFSKRVNAEINEPENITYPALLEVLKRYHYHAVKEYVYIENRTAHVYGATDLHPIFIIDEGKFQKIYQPKHNQKSKRFMYAGEKTKHFIHGIKFIEKAYIELNAQVDESEYENADENEKAEARKTKKIPGAILCTGGSDALNVAVCMGPDYPVIWLNSESEKLDFETYRYLKTKCKNIYNLPDLDNTGQTEAHKLAMLYMDIKTIQLPPELMIKNDWRGNPCKDVRDFFNHYSLSHFRKLVDNALQYEFWIEEPQYNRKGEPVIISGRQKISYTPSNVHLYNFLHKNGFSKFKMNENDAEDIYIQKSGSTVSIIQPKDIRAFINDFLEKQNRPIDLRNSFYKSAQLGETSLSNIKVAELDFKDYDKDYQYLFFKNQSWKITATGIEKNIDGSGKSVWENDVLDFMVDITEPPFNITYNNLSDDFDITINEKDCWFFNYLINTSRIYWKQELEDCYTEHQQAQADEYAAENKFNIAGSNLNAEQIQIQKQHLINKIYSIGYLLHRYKFRSRAWCVMAIDNKIVESNEAHGGSGKSILYDVAMRKIIKQSFRIDGRNENITKEAHLFEGLTRYHRYMIIDDAYQHLNFGRFFGMITGETEVNPKGLKRFSLAFEESPKMAMTINYMLKQNDPSTERRLLYTVFSDYYHFNKQGEYKQERIVSSDFNGKDLFADFDKRQWNLFYNFCARCLQFYLASPRKVEPPMDVILKKQLLNAMGHTFRAWADTYFHYESDATPEQTQFNKRIVKNELYNNFLNENKGTKYSTRSFTKSLKAWCRYHKYTYNPDEQTNDKENNRILETIDGKTHEMVYIQNDSVVINNEIF